MSLISKSAKILANHRKGKDLEGTEEAALAAVKSEYVIPLLQLKEHGRYKFFLFSVH